MDLGSDRLPVRCSSEIFSRRLFENKMKELENELSKKNTSLSELREQLAESREREQTTRLTVTQLKEQVRSDK